MQDVTTQRMNRLAGSDATIPKSETPPRVRKKPGKKRKSHGERSPLQNIALENIPVRQTKKSVKGKANRVSE